MNSNLKEKIIKILRNLKNEASTTGTGPVATGGVQVGGDAVSTPFAFARGGIGNIRAATQIGYKIAKAIKRNKSFKLNNKLESKNRHLTSEGIHRLRFEQDGQVPQPTLTPVEQPTSPTVKQPVVNTATTTNVNLKTYDILTDFTKFDQQLKNSTESLKNNLQKQIQDKILGKKVVIRGSKGYKQPEIDYTVNVTGVSIDYYYDRYMIIVIGREERKQKISKFFIKSGFKIKILGSADNLKPTDKYQVAKSKALVEPDKQSSIEPTNTVTVDEPDLPTQMQVSTEKPKL